jgi:hypothetical protein
VSIQKLVTIYPIIQVSKTSTLTKLFLKHKISGNSLKAKISRIMIKEWNNFYLKLLFNKIRK